MDAETEIARLREAGQLKEVATRAIETYGAEIVHFLEVMLRHHADASDAFAQACEDLWRSLPRFEGRSSMKTWFYTLARHAALRQRRAPHARRTTTLSEITDVAARVRSRTRPHQRTEMKAGLAAIRAALDESDRALLVLRVDRGMSWSDVARVMAEEGEVPVGDDLARAAARLRKRFQSVKESIRARAAASGLMSDDDLAREP
jgi:RNA polymerase sigma-70 factor (ECF subfamily)